MKRKYTKHGYYVFSRYAGTCSSALIRANLGNKRDALKHCDAVRIAEGDNLHIIYDILRDDQLKRYERKHKLTFYV